MWRIIVNGSRGLASSHSKLEMSSRTGLSEDASGSWKYPHMTHTVIWSLLCKPGEAGVGGTIIEDRREGGG